MKNEPWAIGPKAVTSQALMTKAESEPTILNEYVKAVGPCYFVYGYDRDFQKMRAAVFPHTPEGYNQARGFCDHCGGQLIFASLPKGHSESAWNGVDYSEDAYLQLLGDWYDQP